MLSTLPAIRRMDLLAAAIFTILIATAIPSVVQAQATIAGNHADEAAELTTGGGEIAANRTLRVSVTMALRNRDVLQKLIADQQDPSSPMYHRWLTPSEFNDRFGPTSDDLAVVEGWLAKSGLSVESASASHRKVVASGTASVVEKTFAVKIAASPDGVTFANLNDPVVPDSVAKLIASIRGLNNTIHAHRDLAVSTARSIPDVTIGNHTAFGPQDMWTFYDEAELNGAGVTGTGADCIALVESADFQDAAVAIFDTTFALPVANVSRVFIDGATPGSGGGDSLIEADLDVEYAHAAAPGAPITVYVGDSSNGLVDGIDAAVNDDTCGSISLSFEFCGEGPSFYQDTLDPFLNQAATQGQSVFVSAGDEGAAGLKAGKNGCVLGSTRRVSELAADPNVTAVGGTQFAPTFDGSGNATGYTSEQVWRDQAPIPKAQRGAAGGGQSKVFAKPSYQADLFPRSKRRNIPDISFAASPSKPGFFFALGGSITCCIGGTSLGAPVWAGISALASQSGGVTRIGNINAKIYSLGATGNTSSSGLHDVTFGINSLHGVQGFKAMAGYDRVSGWGTPDIGILVPMLGQ